MRTLAENHSLLRRKFGDRQAREIVKRLNELQAAVNLEDIAMLPHARLHLLIGVRKDTLSVDLCHPCRLLFLCLNGSTADRRSVTEIEIVELCLDYH